MKWTRFPIKQQDILRYSSVEESKLANYRTSLDRRRKCDKCNYPEIKKKFLDERFPVSTKSHGANKSTTINLMLCIRERNTLQALELKDQQNDSCIGHKAFQMRACNIRELATPWYPGSPGRQTGSEMAMRKSWACLYTGENVSRKMCPFGATQRGRDLKKSQNRIILVKISDKDKNAKMFKNENGLSSNDVE